MDDPVQQQIRELQQAIAAQESLRTTLGDKIADQTVDALREKLSRLAPTLDRERKLVTCLFCDVVGSTRLARNRDPEEVLAIINGALQNMASGVETYDGYVARFMGDGLLALFGAPRALEHHAEQAIRAGLQIQRQMADYSKHVKGEYGLADFAVRVGINSGYAVAGYVASGKGEYTVIGDAINIANRLETAAPPGGILVGQSTFRLANAQRHFDYEVWPPIDVKGSDVPLSTFQILAAHRESAQIVPVTASRAPLIGRHQELALLQDHLLAVNESRQTQVVTIAGPAGSGKSRLVVEFRNWLFSEFPTARLWVGRSFSYEQHTPYWLVGDMLRNAMNIRETDPAEQRLQRLSDNWSSTAGLTKETFHGLAAILALSHPDDTLTGLEPEAKRKAIYAALIDYCKRQAARGLLVIVFEDTHWADDLSLELIEHLRRALSDAPLLILKLKRPAGRNQVHSQQPTPSWPSDGQAEIVLRNLDPKQTVAMIQALLNAPDLPEWLSTMIYERSLGNPFFVEEIVNDLIEIGALQPENGSCYIPPEMNELHVPDTVQGVLAARIDRLEPALKHIIQYAAVIGRTFWQQLLVNLVDQDVTEQLARLSELGFIHRFGRAAFLADWEWSFRHVLVQEVAYDGVLKETRRPAHAQIARWLEEKGADRIQELAPKLARHFLEGQVWDKAVSYLGTVGERSQNLFALTEAQRFYEQALALIEAHPGVVGDQEKAELLEKRGIVLGLAGDFEGAISDLESALHCARAGEDHAKEQVILINQGMIYRRADDYENATSRLSMALDAARKCGDQRSLADALFHLGSVVWSRGENLEATGYHQQALDICRREQFKDLVAVQATHGRAEAYYISGQLDKAFELFDESLVLARQIGDRSYEAENLQMIAMLNGGQTGVANYELCLKIAGESLQISRDAHLDWHTSSTLYTLVEGSLGRGNYRAAFDYLKEAKGLALAIRAIRFLSLLTLTEGQIYLELNQPKRAEKSFRQSSQLSKEANTYLWSTRFQAGVALARLQQGDRQVGLLLKEALAAARNRGQQLFFPHCFEGLAELALAQGANAQAEHYAASMLASAEQNGQREKSVVACRLRGVARMAIAASSDSSPNKAAQDLQQAYKLAQELESPYQLRKSHQALAQLYRYQGDQAQADAHTAAQQAITQTIVDNLQNDELTRGMVA